MGFEKDGIEIFLDFFYLNLGKSFWYVLQIWKGFWNFFKVLLGLQKEERNSFKFIRLKITYKFTVFIVHVVIFGLTFWFA